MNAADVLAVIAAISGCGGWCLNATWTDVVGVDQHVLYLSLRGGRHETAQHFVEGDLWQLVFEWWSALVDW